MLVAASLPPGCRRRLPGAVPIAQPLRRAAAGQLLDDPDPARWSTVNAEARDRR
jgi:hypothetical protein